MSPLLSVLYSFLIAIILYIVFRLIIGFDNRLSQISSIISACLCCIYLIIINEFKNFVLFKNNIKK